MTPTNAAPPENTAVGAALFGAPHRIADVYAQGRRERIAALTALYSTVVNAENFDEHASHLHELQVIFATWGMPALSPQQLESLPALRAVFYAAGSVQHFARPLLERGVVIVSAWQALAATVAEFVLAQILLANKGYWRNRHDYQSPAAYASAFRGRGNFSATVALLGAGAVGRHLIQLLRPFDFQVVVFDPFLSREDAAQLGVEKVSLEDAFARGDVVSNHLANKPETTKLLNAPLFELLRDDATFINTGRGATVDEDALINALQARPSLTALLDVTGPEPPVAGSPFYNLPNAHLTTHIAGSIGGEVLRLADVCIEEFTTWRDGGPLRYAVSLDMLTRMA